MEGIDFALKPCFALPPPDPHQTQQTGAEQPGCCRDGCGGYVDVGANSVCCRIVGCAGECQLVGGGINAIRTGQISDVLIDGDRYFIIDRSKCVEFVSIGFGNRSGAVTVPE